MAGDTKFKQIGKFQFSLDIPIDSDLMLAIELAKEKRDKTITDLSDLLKSGIIIDELDNKDNKEKISRYVEGILKMNESIKLMEDAAVAVRMYKLDQKNNEEHNK
jgi:hypothetical protein